MDDCFEAVLHLEDEGKYSTTRRVLLEDQEAHACALAEEC